MSDAIIDDAIVIIERQILSLERDEGVGMVMDELNQLLAGLRARDDFLVNCQRRGAGLYETWTLYPKELQVRELPK